MNWLLLFTLIIGITASNPVLEVLEEEIPEDVSRQIRSILEKKLFRVRIIRDSTAEFWFREKIPLITGRQGSLGINFGALEQGTLLGIVRFSSQWMDYKNKPVKAGVYCLRYGTQPADGDHTGSTFYRDFLLLLPAAMDQEVALAPEHLLELSQQGSGTTHPIVMALFPVWELPDQNSVLKNELDQPILVFKRDDLTLGIVLSGHGELEGY